MKSLELSPTPSRLLRLFPIDRITQTFLSDNLRSRVIWIYFLMLTLLTWTVFALESNDAKACLTSLNLVLFVVPLMALLYPTIYIYNSHEFVVLLLCQPITRNKIWRSLFHGVTGSLTVAFVIGVGLPLLLYNPNVAGIVILLLGIAATYIFSGLAFLIAIKTNNRTTGVGIAVIIWLVFTVLYDGLLLFTLLQLSEYPIDKLIMSLLMLNPIDVTRFDAILCLDQQAMMGFSGAAFYHFLGQSMGVITSALILIAWMIVPFSISRLLFLKKDL